MTITPEQYIINRKVYKRPQAMVLSDNPGIETAAGWTPEGEEFVDFIVLSDHNRSTIKISPERIATRKRMINGRMRSYWVADKLKISTSWNELPSRGWPASSQLQNGINMANYSDKFTVDGGAGGNELLEWYRGHKGSFWVFLAYDRYPKFINKPNPWDRLSEYNEVVEVFIDDFSYDIVKRGGSNMDFWDIDLSLEEA